MADVVSGMQMDEVLASIRRLIAEDAPAPPRAGEPREDEDVLELGESPGSPDAREPVAGAETLLSDRTEAASRQALAALSTLSIDPQAGADTLDGLVRDLLRPMLRDWLDAHLPDLVERLVAREVARLGGR